MSVFLVFGRSQNFDFLGFFLVGLKILVGSYGAVLVGVSIPPTQPCKEEARRPLLGLIFNKKSDFCRF